MPSATDFYQDAVRALKRRLLKQAIDNFNLAELYGHLPDLCASGRWEAFMLLGLFEEAWSESDAIIARGNPDPHRLWQGDDFRGKRIIVRCLHGLGDAIQFLRYVSLLKQEARFVSIEGPKRLMPLVATMDGVDSVVSWETPGAQYPDYDVQIEIMQLPYAYRTTLATIPHTTPYFLLPLSQRHERRSANKPRVGLVWAASEWDESRSLPLKDLMPILQMPEFEFCALQAGPQRNEIFELTKTCVLHDFTGETEDLLQTAHLLRSFDLLISVDTMMAHLAGALAIPVWVLLGPVANWRWMLDRIDSPWYPSMRIFRRAPSESWKDLASSVRSALLEWLEHDTANSGRVFAERSRGLGSSVETFD